MQVIKFLKGVKIWLSKVLGLLTFPTPFIFLKNVNNEN